MKVGVKPNAAIGREGGGYEVWDIGLMFGLEN